MRPPRLKLRTLIVLVALVALAAGGVEYRRRAAFLRCARYPWLAPPVDESEPTARQRR